MILVVGATGQLGMEICRQLTAHGLLTRALVRASSDPARVERLHSLDIPVMQGDLSDRATLDAACHGASAAICTASSMPFAYQAGLNDIHSVDLDGVCSLIDAARAAGVRHFVATSFSSNLDLDFPLRNAKRQVERHLRASGMNYTVLRPTFFMEVWLSPAVGFDAAAHKATIYGAGNNRISWISLRDVAAFAVQSLTHPAARNATLELGGPEPLTPHQVIAIHERLAHHHFEVTHVLAATLQARFDAATDPMEKSFAALMLGYARGDWIEMTDLLRQFPIHLSSVQAYAAAHAPQALAL